MSPEPTVDPLIDFCYLGDELDRERLREAVRLADDLIHHRELVQFARTPRNHGSDDLRRDLALDRWLSAAVGTPGHSCGTCMMGPETDPLAVVDQLGAVRGIDGLSVVDASIMPDAVRANLNATTMMLAEYIAEMSFGATETRARWHASEARSRK